MILGLIAVAFVVVVVLLPVLRLWERTYERDWRVQDARKQAREDES